LRNPVFQRVALAVLPAMIIGSIALFAVWGDNGLFARHRLQAEMHDANSELATVERENQALLRELHVADQDPIVLERMVAEELGWGRAGSTLYRFED
jgi:cell division protein FtsB